MPRFVELWIYLSATPLFGLTATLAVYLLAHAAYTRLDNAPWANPVLWSVVVLASALLVTRGRLSHLLRGGAVHPLPARPRRGGAGLAALAATRGVA
jgi:hypothetical protein